jgi:hypothetical protein
MHAAYQQGSSRRRQLNVGEDSTCFVSALHMATCNITAGRTHTAEDC